MAQESKALTRIQAEGYRSLKSVELAPGRVTVLIGANGSGKSNLLSLLRMVALMRTQSLRRFIGESGGASALLHYGPKVTKELNLRLEFEQETGGSAYGARLGYAAADTLIYLDETVEYRPVGGADFEDVRFLRSDGSNLAAYLRSLSASSAPARQAAWRRINQLVRRVAPFIKSLQPAWVGPAHPESSAVRLNWVDERDQVFGPHQLSDGTLRCIALFTALGQPAEELPAFLSIDEPELGLHPAALVIFASLVQSASAHARSSWPRSRPPCWTCSSLRRSSSRSGSRGPLLFEGLIRTSLRAGSAPVQRAKVCPGMHSGAAQTTERLRPRG